MKEWKTAVILILLWAIITFSTWLAARLALATTVQKETEWLMAIMATATMGMRVLWNARALKREKDFLPDIIMVPIAATAFVCCALTIHSMAVTRVLSLIVGLLPLTFFLVLRWYMKLVIWTVASGILMAPSFL